MAEEKKTRRRASYELVKLSDWRIERGLTQKALAEASGVAVSTVKGAETGSRKDPLIAAKLAKALGVSVDELRGKAS